METPILFSRMRRKFYWRAFEWSLSLFHNLVTKGPNLVFVGFTWYTSISLRTWYTISRTLLSWLVQPQVSAMLHPFFGVSSQGFLLSPPGFVTCYCFLKYVLWQRFIARGMVKPSQFLMLDIERSSFWQPSYFVICFEIILFFCALRYETLITFWQHLYSKAYILLLQIACECPINVRV